MKKALKETRLSSCQAKAERELDWNRRAIDKGIKQVTNNITQIYNYRARERKKTEYHLPKLLLRLIVQLINPNVIARE